MLYVLRVAHKIFFMFARTPWTSTKTLIERLDRDKTRCVLGPLRGCGLRNEHHYGVVGKKHNLVEDAAQACPLYKGR